MTSPKTGPLNGSSLASRQRRQYRAWALAWIGLGLLLLAGNLGLFEGGPLEQAWPLGLALLGALLIWRLPAGAAAAFAVPRGSFAEAELRLSTWLADARLGAFAGVTQLAVGEFSAFVGPRLQADGPRARLSLDARAAAPLVYSDWSAALAKGLPWTLDLWQGLGHASLNLRDLNVARLNLRNLAGDVELFVPGQGQAEFNLNLGLGDLTVRVPEGVGLRLKVAAGPLAGVRVDATRFSRLAPGEWESPGFAAAAHRCTLEVSLGAGDMELASL